MTTKRIFEDTISENDYTRGLKSVSTRPEDDSPGDSESDAGAEFEMGLEFRPGENLEPELDSEPLPKHPIKEIPETAKVVSSEQPSPWLSRE